MDNATTNAEVNIALAQFRERRSYMLLVENLAEAGCSSRVARDVIDRAFGHGYQMQLDVPLCSLPAEMVIAACTHWLGIDVNELQSLSRRMRITTAKKVCILMLKKYTTDTLKEIAHALGLKDHSSVLYNMTVGNNWLQTDESFRATYIQIDKQLKQIAASPNAEAA